MTVTGIPAVDDHARVRKLTNELSGRLVSGITMDVLHDSLAALDLTLAPRETAAPGVDRVRAAATGQAVVIGQYGDRSGWADFCYGPYDRDRAEAIAGLLTEGNWHSMQWLVISLGVLPGGET